MILRFIRCTLGLLVLAGLLGPTMMAIAMAPAHAEEEAAPAAEGGEKKEKPPKPPKGGEDGDEGEAKPKKDKDGKLIELDTPGPHYVKVMPMMLPVIGDDGPEQLVTLIITLEVDKQDDVDLVKKNMPRLTDAYMQKLYGALDKRMVTRGTLIDVELVKKRLDAPTKKILGPDVVKDILVQSIAQRHL